jgi:predicted nucleic acid-binding protein
MTGWLIDTDVLGRLTPEYNPQEFHPEIVNWLQKTSDPAFLSAWSIAEITDIAAELRQKGKLEDADELTAWIASLVKLHGPRILPLDARVAKVAGEIIRELKIISAYMSVSTSDIIIAATARAHGLGVLTTDLVTFEFVKDIVCQNPFDPKVYASD